MGTKTAIQWTDATWNPVRGCSRISEGCRNCYAERMAARFSKPGMWAHGFAEMTKSGTRWTGKLAVVPEHLEDPLRWKEPRRIFVNSMSDLFHEALTFADIAAIFQVMKAAKHHTFQVLTKRADKMLSFMQAWGGQMVLPNVWLGVSVEDQEAAVKRIPLLLRTPAAVRFLSCEPLIGPVKLCPALLHDPLVCHKPLDWVIVGGESGPGARQCEIRWVRSIVNECKRLSTAVFVKQLGAHIIDRNDAGFDGGDPECWPQDTETDDRPIQFQGDDARILLRSSKGGDMEEWPEDLRVRQFPDPCIEDQHRGKECKCCHFVPHCCSHHCCCFKRKEPA